MRLKGGITAFLLAVIAPVLPTIAQDTIQPKIVPQILPYGGVEVAAWTPDDRYIVAANSTARVVLIWDVENGHVVDRLILPSDNPDAAISVRRFTDISVDEDGKNATIVGEAAYATTDDPVGRTTGLAYRLNLETRETSPLLQVGGGVRRGTRGIAAQAAAQIAAHSVASKMPDFKAINKSAEALEVLYENSQEMERAAAEALLPPLPVSHDGTRRLVRIAEGLAIRPVTPQNGETAERKLALDRNVKYSDVQISHDGELLAMMYAIEQDEQQALPKTAVDIFEIGTGVFHRQIELEGVYTRIEWTATNQFIAIQGTSNEDKEEAWGGENLPAALAVNAYTGEIDDLIEGRCHMAFAPDFKAVFGAGTGNCRTTADQNRALQRFDLETGVWRDFGELRLEKGGAIDNVAVSPDAGTVAVSTASADGVIELVVLDGVDGRILGRFKPPNLAFVAKLAADDDRSLFVAGDGKTAVWFVEDGASGWIELPLRSVLTRLVDANERIIAVAGLIDDGISRWDFENNEILAPIDFASVLSGGFLPGRPIFWAFSQLEGLRFWNSDTWSELMNVWFFDGQGYLAATPEGRYDTNLGADANQFRWLVPDRPFQSLSAQTFMRDYFQPGLIERTMTCTYLDICDAMFDPLPSIAELNRVLPIVRITEVKAGQTPDEALVSIEVTEGVDPTAPNGKTRSGVFNPRLFRDFRFAAHTPDSDFELDQSIEGWREVNRMTDDDDQPGDGVYHFDAVLYLPTAKGTEEQIISAYAFNEDRIKSDTVYFTYTRPPMEAVQPRAFVISIGIDDYKEKRLKLNYAAADARLMAGQLSNIPGFETRTIVAAAPQGGKAQVNADTIRYLLAMLSGEVERKEALDFLKADGINAGALDMVGPDDIVIITFSGHGWTQDQDDFYLLAADASWADDKDLPDPESLISSSELTMWLRKINAAEIAIVIDACHSGASVDSGNFKPGPMGDAGLGQLAFDKGIRILAATQAGDVAMENDKLRHGLLTFALAGDGEGLARTDAVLDMDADGKISLTEWMFYPTWRLPAFNEDSRLAKGDNASEESVGFAFPRRSPALVERVQQPSLFDFGQPSPVVLKEIAP